MVVVSLHPELIDSILSLLCGTPSITECALVCHSWLPCARHYLWAPHKVLHLNRMQIAEFLRLLDSPESTLLMISFNTLSLSQWRPRHPDAVYSDDDPWRDTAVQNLLARNLSFPSITSLILEQVDCRTLSQKALASLRNNYQSVKELELRCIAFISSELCGILSALPALEKITFSRGIACQSVPSTVNSVQITHSRLSNLVFNTEILPSSIIRFFARTIRYTTGIATVETKIPMPREHKHDMFGACGELLETAGMSLRAFKFRPSYSIANDQNTGDAVSFTELIGFPRNPNLEEIEIGQPGFGEAAIISLIQGLKVNPKPALRRLKLGLEMLSGWEKWTKTWLLVDETLSRMSLEDPKLIIDIPPLESPSPFREWEGFDPEQKKVLEKAYFESSSDKVKSYLPRTMECWELEVVVFPF
ncbi:hypothetical protein C0989_008307 [Termitomyces sp. Mn162]|nr:hypothetical protein C0989_008307 [Termitomyces sp. Mn162]